MNGHCPSYAIGIVAHQSRADAATHLYKQVGADVISMDNPALRLGAETNHRRVWTGLHDMRDDADWLVVLEDDAIPVHGFRHQLAQALAVAPAPYVSLYFGRGFPRQWQKRYRETVERADPADCWAITSGWMMHAVGIAVQTPLVPGMIRHLDQAIGVPTDQAIGQHARNTKQSVAYTLPSLVDHTDGPTIHTHQDGQPRTPGRTAWTVGTRTTWTTQAIQMG